MTTQELKQQIDKVLGNSIRCLLPSYWWKRLFNQVADRIDDVEQSTSKLIDSKVEEVKMPIVESVDELSKLNVEKGGVAAVKKVGEPVVVNIEDCYISLDYVNDWEKYTIIKGVGEIGEVPSDAGGGFIPLIADKYNFYADTLVVGIEDGKRVYGKYLRSGVSIFTLDEVNEYLASGRYRLTGGYLSDRIAQYFTFYSAVPQPSLYIKGDSWERLAKESDLEGIEGGGSGEIKEEVNALKEQVDALTEKSKVVRVYATIGKEGSLDNVLLPEEYKERNKEIYERVANGEVLFADIYGGFDYVESIYYTSTRYYTALKGTLVNNAIVFRVEDSGLYDSWLRHIEIKASGSATVYDEYIINKTHVDNSVIIDMSNLVTKEELGNKADKSDIKTINGVSLLGGGNLQLGELITIDSELSDTSTNAVQNKVVKAYIDNAIGNTLNTEV